MKTTKNTMKNGHIFPDHPYRILVIGGSGSGKTNIASFDKGTK